MRIHLSALGCRLNEAELEQWAEAFSRAGDQIVDQASDADILVFNSCAVTAEAVRKSRQRVQRLQRQQPRAKIVLSGCYSSLEPASSLAELGVDLVIPNSRKDHLVDDTRQAFTQPIMPAGATLPGEAPLFRRNRQRAFIKIQDGCRYRCTFCIVTVARGAERSRALEDLIAEVQQLHAKGIQEVVLTGVHVGGYGSDLDIDLKTLVQALLTDTDMPRIRFASVEPWDLPDDFLDLFTNSRLMPHMHLPLQSGCDTVLRRMARRCKTADFAALTRNLKSAVPGFNVTTDIIVGFPGETTDEWQTGLEFLDTQRFGHMHIFSYSERAGTKAASLADPVPMPLRQARSRELHAIAEHHKVEVQQRALGEVHAVLWESAKPLKTDGSVDEMRFQHDGYTPNYLRVRIVTDTDMTNQIVPVHLTSIEDGLLMGQLVN